MREAKAGPSRFDSYRLAVSSPLNLHILNIPRIMIQSSRLRPLLLSTLLALPFVGEPFLPGSLRAEEKKIEFPASSQHSVVK